MAVGEARVFPGFLTPVLTRLFFPKPPTTFLTCFCRGERRKYAGKKSRLNRGSNSNHQIISPIRSPLSHPGGASHVDCVIKLDVNTQAIHLRSENIRGIPFYVLKVPVVYKKKKKSHVCCCRDFLLAESLQ